MLWRAYKYGPAWNEPACIYVCIKVYYNVTLLIPLETDVEPLYGSIELTRAWTKNGTSGARHQVHLD